MSYYPFKSLSIFQCKQSKNRPIDLLNFNINKIRWVIHRQSAMSTMKLLRYSVCYHNQKYWYLSENEISLANESHKEAACGDTPNNTPITIISFTNGWSRGGMFMLRKTFDGLDITIKLYIKLEYKTFIWRQLMIYKYVINFYLCLLPNKKKKPYIYVYLHM